MKARISKDASRYSLWKQIFGTDTVPILEPPTTGPDGKPRILVDVRDMGMAVKRNLAIKFAKWRKIPSDRMMIEIEQTGSVVLSGEGVEVVEEGGNLF